MTILVIAEHSNVALGVLQPSIQLLRPKLLVAIFMYWLPVLDLTQLHKRLQKLMA